MRPDVLFPLFAAAATLAGVGPRTAKFLARLVADRTDGREEARVVDLLWHLPSAIIDRRFAPVIADAPPGHIVTLSVTVVRHQFPRAARVPYKVQCEDASGTVDLVYFNAKRD